MSARNLIKVVMEEGKMSCAQQDPTISIGFDYDVGVWKIQQVHCLPRHELNQVIPRDKQYNITIEKWNWEKEDWDEYLSQQLYKLELNVESLIYYLNEV